MQLYVDYYFIMKNKDAIRKAIEKIKANFGKYIHHEECHDNVFRLLLQLPNEVQIFALDFYSTHKLPQYTIFHNNIHRYYFRDYNLTNRCGKFVPLHMNFNGAYVCTDNYSGRNPNAYKYVLQILKIIASHAVVAIVNDYSGLYEKID